MDAQRRQEVLVTTFYRWMQKEDGVDLFQGHNSAFPQRESSGKSKLLEIKTLSIVSKMETSILLFQCTWRYMKIDLMS